MPAIAVPDEGWAKEDWRSDLLVVSRKTRVYPEMKSIYERILAEQMGTCKQRSEGYVYVMRDPTKPGVKVGVSVDIKQRKNALRSMTPNLEVHSSFYTMDTYGVEKLVHQFGRIVEQQDPFPNNHPHEWVYLTPTEASVCVMIAVKVVQDELSARLACLVSREPGDRASVPPS